MYPLRSMRLQENTEQRRSRRVNQKLKMPTTLFLISIHHSISSVSEHQRCPRGTDQKPHICCALSASPSLYFLVQPLAFNCPDPPLPCPSAVGPLRPPASAPDASSASSLLSSCSPAYDPPAGPRHRWLGSQ